MKPESDFLKAWMALQGAYLDRYCNWYSPWHHYRVWACWLYLYYLLLFTT